MLRSLKPGLKVLYSSGYNRESIEGDTHPLTRGDYLPKPYSPTVLAQAVRKCLDGTASSEG